MNGTAKLYLNSTQIPHEILREWMPKLSDTELRVLLVVTDQTLGWVEDTLTKRRKEKDWLSYTQLIEKTGRNREAISKAIKSLEDKNLIEVLDMNGDLIKQGLRSGKQLFYRLKTSSKTEQVPPNQFENRNSEIEHTKETNTKETLLRNGGAAKKQPSCPLLNGSPLRAKYPDGHKECAQYLVSCEQIRGKKFINRAKQFEILHKILKAGYDFPDMDRVMAKVEKKYGDNNWDFATLANWLEKGGADARYS